MNYFKDTQHYIEEAAHKKRRIEMRKVEAQIRFRQKINIGLGVLATISIILILKL